MNRQRDTMTVSVLRHPAKRGMRGYQLEQRGKVSPIEWRPDNLTVEQVRTEVVPSLQAKLIDVVATLKGRNKCR